MSELMARLEGSLVRRGNSPGEERRKAARFLLRDVRGSMNWGEDEVAREVAVLNISGGGAAVLTEEAPVVGQTIRLRLHCESARLGPIEARVESATPDGSGKQVVRLRFLAWMPMDWLMDRNRERRLWERYPAFGSRASVTWLEGGAEKTTDGELLNISGGGAAFVADELPPAGVPIWLQLRPSARHLEELDAVEARLVTTSSDPSGMKIAHLQFLSPCPMEFFELAVDGEPAHPEVSPP